MASESTTMRYGVLIISFVPLLVKAISYALIGGYMPGAVLVLFGGYVVWSVKRGPNAEKKGIKIWGAAIVVWGIARLLLMVLFVVSPISEAHVESQFTMWYVAVSLFHILLGIHLYRQAVRIFRAV